MNPIIYVACLAAYNNSKLHGRHIELLGKTTDEVGEEIQAMLDSSPIPDAEEWAIHDYEGFGTYKVSEYHDLDELIEVADLLSEPDGPVVLELMSHMGFDTVSEAKDYHEENYAGQWDSLEDFAANFLEDTGQLSEIPENLQCYFDYEKFARDLEIGGDVFVLELDRNKHVYWNR